MLHRMIQLPTVVLFALVILLLVLLTLCVQHLLVPHWWPDAYQWLVQEPWYRLAPIVLAIPARHITLRLKVRAARVKQSLKS